MNLTHGIALLQVHLVPEHWSTDSVKVPAVSGSVDSSGEFLLPMPSGYEGSHVRVMVVFAGTPDAIMFSGHVPLDEEVELVYDHVSEPASIGIFGVLRILGRPTSPSEVLLYVGGSPRSFQDHPAVVEKRDDHMDLKISLPRYREDFRYIPGDAVLLVRSRDGSVRGATPRLLGAIQFRSVTDLSRVLSSRAELRLGTVRVFAPQATEGSISRMHVWYAGCPHLGLSVGDNVEQGVEIMLSPGLYGVAIESHHAGRSSYGHFKWDGGDGTVVAEMDYQTPGSESLDVRVVGSSAAVPGGSRVTALLIEAESERSLAVPHEVGAEIDANGLARLTGMIPGHYRLRTSIKGMPTCEGVVRVPEERAAILDIAQSMRWIGLRWPVESGRIANHSIMAWARPVGSADWRALPMAAMGAEDLPIEWNGLFLPLGKAWSGEIFLRVGNLTAFHRTVDDRTSTAAELAPVLLKPPAWCEVAVSSESVESNRRLSVTSGIRGSDAPCWTTSTDELGQGLIPVVPGTSAWVECGQQRRWLEGVSPGERTRWVLNQ
ncbi:MAG: hypothetical protein AB7I19_07185 [Planctomycetota bacterium]